MEIAICMVEMKELELRSDSVIIDHMKSDADRITLLRIDGRTVDYVATSDAMIETHVKGVVSLLNARGSTQWWRDNTRGIVQATLRREHDEY